MKQVKKISWITLSFAIMHTISLNAHPATRTEPQKKAQQSILALHQIATQLTEQSTQELLLQEILMGQTLNFALQGCSWWKQASIFPIAKGFPANASFLYYLFRVLYEIKPQSIIEFGIGETSRITTRYAKYYTTSKLLLIEDDTNFIEVIKRDTPQASNIVFTHLPIEKREYKGYKTTGYKGLAKLAENNKFNLIIVDGPRGNKNFSRISVIDLIPNQLAESFVIILDDINRQGEQETAGEVFKLLDSVNIKYNFTIKGGSRLQLLIYSKDLSFIHFW